MPAAIVIPARHASSRLPGKPLLKETGKYLVQHVHERACLARRGKDPRAIAQTLGMPHGEVELMLNLHVA